MSSTRYSQRILWANQPNAIAIAVQQFRSSDRQLLDLTVSNPTAVGISYPHRDIGAAFAEIREFTYDPDPLGLISTRQAICSYYERHGIAVTPERVVCTASTSEAYGLVFKLFCDPGDEVLCPTPSYPLFEYLAACESVTAVSYRLSYDGAWFIDFAQLSESLTPRSRALILVNPNNPTGSCLKEAEWEALASMAVKRGLPIISDEVFMDFAFQPRRETLTTLVGRDEILSFSLNGLSKCAGMPQMKLGWIVLNGPERERSRARERLELLLDTYLSVNTPVQLAAQKLLEIGMDVQAQLRARTFENLRCAEAVLANSAAQVLCAEGGWSGIVKLPGIKKEEDWVLHLLQEEGVLVQPGYFFDMPQGAYMVVSLITSPQIFAEGISRIRRLVDENTSP